MTYVQPHQWKALVETFWMIWQNTCLSWKITKIRTTPLFFKIDICSATAMQSSRRDLLNYKAEHRSILKKENDLPRFTSTFKTGKNSQKQLFCFYCVLWRSAFSPVVVQNRSLRSHLFSKNRGLEVKELLAKPPRGLFNWPKIKQSTWASKSTALQTLEANLWCDSSETTELQETTWA